MHGQKNIKSPPKFVDSLVQNARDAVCAHATRCEYCWSYTHCYSSGL